MSDEKRSNESYRRGLAVGVRVVATKPGDNFVYHGTVRHFDDSGDPMIDIIDDGIYRFDARMVTRESEYKPSEEVSAVDDEASKETPPPGFTQAQWDTVCKAIDAGTVVGMSTPAEPSDARYQGFVTETDVTAEKPSAVLPFPPRRPSARAQKPKEQELVRFECKLTPESFARLSELRRQTDAVSNTEVVRKAVGVFALLVSEIKKGGEVHLVRGNGEVLLLNHAILIEGA